MAATGLQMNWAAVGYTPSGGTLGAITKIIDVNFDFGAELLGFSGDNDRYDTTIVNSMNRPGATVTTGNIGLIAALVPGTVGTLTATNKDAKGATGGDIVYTLSNAVVGTNTATSPHAQFGTGTITFRAYSNDGATSPMGFTRA